MAWGRAFRCYLQTAGSASLAVIRWWLLKWTNWMISCEWNSGKCLLSLLVGPFFLFWIGGKSLHGVVGGWVLPNNWVYNIWMAIAFVLVSLQHCLCWACAAVWCCLMQNSVLYLLPFREGSIWKSKCCENGAHPVEFLSSGGLLDLSGCSVPTGGSPSLQMRFDPC